MDHLRIAILENPAAGVGRAIPMAQKLSAKLSERNIQYALFDKEWPADLTSFTDVWIVGGDGTLNYFVNRYPHLKKYPTLSTDN